jgi:hypothetical protein
MYGCAGDVTSPVGAVLCVALRAACHAALAGLRWSVFLGDALQDVLTAGCGVDVLTWHAALPDGLVAVGDHGAHCLADVCAIFSW